MTSNEESFYAKHFLGVELVLGVVLGLTFTAWVQCFWGQAIVSGLLKGNEVNLFGVIASIAGSILGFVLATVSIVFAFLASPRLTIVRESKSFPYLWKIFLSAIHYLGLTTLAAIAAIIFANRPAVLSWAVCVVLTLSIVSALRIWRCVWALRRIIDIVVKG